MMLLPHINTYIVSVLSKSSQTKTYLYVTGTNVGTNMQKYHTSVLAAGFESSLVVWRAIRPHSKWPFKVECIDRERGRGANMPENTGSSLVTIHLAEEELLTETHAHLLTISHPPIHTHTHMQNFIVSAQ